MPILPPGFTIGIITPFKSLADEIRQIAYPYFSRLGDSLNAERIGTVNAFQGGECSLIFLVLGLTSKTAHGKVWYATDSNHAYIYNVAVSRAKCCCIIIGDRARCASYPSPALRKLAAERRPRKPGNESIGPGETVLKHALERLGLNPAPQYPLGTRFLDLALVDSQLDIEVDGVSYHTNSFGERKQSDYYRDCEVASYGWKVIRLWHHEVMEDPDGCARRLVVEHRERLARKDAMP